MEWARLDTGWNLLLHEKQVSIMDQSNSECAAYANDRPSICPSENLVVKDTGTQYKLAINQENAGYIFRILKAFLYENQEVEETSTATMKTACVGVTSINGAKPLLCLGRKIFITLATIGYAARICGNFSILKWPNPWTRKRQIKKIENFHQPGMATEMSNMQCFYRKPGLHEF